jgi:hypothetical protein
MKELLSRVGACPNTEEAELVELRKALLQIDREETRARGQRRLERIVDRRHPVLGSIAQGGLASSALWSGDLNRALYWARSTVLKYPMTPAALWCATLLVSIYRMMGMKRERFEAEGERFRIMRKIALQSEHANDRIFALHELHKELEARDLRVDAERCAEELFDLMRRKPETTTELQRE